MNPVGTREAQIQESGAAASPLLRALYTRTRIQAARGRPDLRRSSGALHADHRARELLRVMPLSVAWGTIWLMALIGLTLSGLAAVVVRRALA